MENVPRMYPPQNEPAENCGSWVVGTAPKGIASLLVISNENSVIGSSPHWATAKYQVRAMVF